MRIITLALFQLLFALNLAVAADASDVNTKVVNGFMEYYKYGLDEKLYLQTDKPYYSTGEDVWFKGFLVNAITHAPINFSNYMYVELIDNEGELVSRVKVKRDSTAGFSGYISLDPQMTPGEFSLRAYTRWMTNSDPDFFFQKNITIVSAIPEGSMAAAANLSEADIKSASAKRAAQKEAKKKEAQKLEYDLQFFPEGGGLVAGVPQLVAFKALAEDGLAIELKGTIYNAAGEAVTTIETFNSAMGYVQLNVPEGEQYYAEVHSAEEVTKKFNLPLSSTSEIALKVSRVGTNLYYQPLTTDPSKLEGMSAVIHSRGRIVLVDTMSMASAHKIALDNLYDGVSVISLINSAQEVVSERIVFKKPTAMPSVTITPSSTNYERRQQASVNLQIKGSNGAPAQGQFAVSVTDDKAISQDSLADNAVSYLLLSSEIKGFIENPGSYFADNSKLTDSKLDLLMMTQGWRRFDLEKILDPETNHRRELQYEDVVQISGEVKGFFGNKARKPRLSLICQRLGLIDSYDLDESNRFSLMDIDIPDSAVYVIQTQGKNGGNSLTLKLDEDPAFPEPKAAEVFYRDVDVIPFEFVNQSVEKFYYEGGLTMIQLESVVVTTQAVSKIEHAEFASKSSDREELATMGGSQLTDVLTRYIGIQVDYDNSEVTYRGSSVPVKFYVNGMEEDFTSISILTVDLIEQIDFFDEIAASGLFTDSSGGVFNITLLDGASIPSLRLPNIVNYAPLGYQMKKVFYEPTYETKSKKDNLPPDYRTTIYWSGDINPDADGNVDFDFYTADKTTSYRITVEGVTSSGEVCHEEVVVDRTKQ
ncbi:MAG: hypothetical protein SNG02_02630 [Rikenellaceae bacterium]